MRHWTVSLIREGGVAREWHVWADTLTVGSHGAAKVRLPQPVEPWALRISELPEPQVFQLAEFTLRVADTTAERAQLWERAQVRIETARARIERESEAETAPVGPSTLHTAITALALAGVTHWLAELAGGGEVRELEVVTAIAAARAHDEPRAPFEAHDSAAEPTISSAGIVAGIALSKAPAAVRTAILSTASSTWAHVAQGSGADLCTTAPDGLPRFVLASASWPDGEERSPLSPDRPPPEPPH